MLSGSVQCGERKEAGQTKEKSDCVITSLHPAPEEPGSGMALQRYDLG